MLEPDTFDRIPKDTPWSIERSFFPSLIEREGNLRAPTSTAATGSTSARPRKYMQVHRDIMDGRYTAIARMPFARGAGRRLDLAGGARSRKARSSRAPASSTRARVVKAGAHIGPYSVVGRQCHIEEHAVLDTRDRLGQQPHQPGSGRPRARSSAASATSAATRLVEDGVVLGDKSVVTDYSRL